jgi:chromosome segregation ATPase
LQKLKDQYRQEVATTKRSAAKEVSRLNRQLATLRELIDKMKTKANAKVLETEANARRKVLETEANARRKELELRRGYSNLFQTATRLNNERARLNSERTVLEQQSRQLRAEVDELTNAITKLKAEDEELKAEDEKRRSEAILHQKTCSEATLLCSGAISTLVSIIRKIPRDRQDDIKDLDNVQHWIIQVRKSLHTMVSAKSLHTMVSANKDGAFYAKPEISFGDTVRWPDFFPWGDWRDEFEAMK